MASTSFPLMALHLNFYRHSWKLHHKCQFLMLSREIPPFPSIFKTLKMRQEAFILRNEDLAFTQEEIRTFFHEIRKISFNAEQLSKIHLATEGWIGGLILLSESCVDSKKQPQKS